MTTRALVRPLVRNLLRSPTTRGSSWSPSVLFANGEQGGWWDPSDFSTMFQDSAGTTPVTAVGQPVGLIRDKSGRGNHRTQATAASRPVLQQDGSGFFYLAYDGVDDSMVTAAAVDFSGTDKMTVVAGVRKLSDAGGGVLVELTADSSANNGAFYLAAPPAAASATVRFRSRGTAGADAESAGTFASPISVVATGQGDISGDVSSLRLNGVVAATTLTDQGVGNYANAVASFGQRIGGTVRFNGREYQTIIRGAASTAAQIAQAERFVGSKMGIAL